MSGRSISAQPVAPVTFDTPDEAAVKTVIESVANCVDRHDFVSLERLYADEVTRDYTSMSGGSPQVLSIAALIKRWSETLPGFERTRHNLSNLSVQVTGGDAVANVDVVASHWIEDICWIVAGQHNYRLLRVGRDWRVTAQTFNFSGESGSREAIVRAGAVVRALQKASEQS